jgi:hypothetical protein
MSRETKWARVARLATDGMRFDAQTEPAEQIAARIHQIGGGGDFLRSAYRCRSTASKPASSLIRAVEILCNDNANPTT